MSTSRFLLVYSSPVSSSTGKASMSALRSTILPGPFQCRQLMCGRRNRGGKRGVWLLFGQHSFLGVRDRGFGEGLCIKIHVTGDLECEMTE